MVTDSLNCSFEDNYAESTKETLVGLYSKRDKNGQPIETVTDIVRRVARAVALAELKYCLSPAELVELSLEQALKNSTVRHWALTFADNIGNQRYWANTPGNINSDPEVSLKVLQYWAYGKLAKLEEKQIWTLSEDYRKHYEDDKQYFPEFAAGTKGYYLMHMGRIASEVRGKGCLAACGVAQVQDTLESIQECARIETMAAKSAMGMGLNTSTLRPWSSIISTNGAAASGPDRFYEKTISKAVEAVAQGGRRGGALIEIRNSDHPDILFFLDKKRIPAKPTRSSVKSDDEYDKQLIAWHEKQNYLKNTNITVLAMPGFMEAVKQRKFYPAVFAGKHWNGKLFDPRRPIVDAKGNPAVNRLTKEPLFEEYAVDMRQYRSCVDAVEPGMEFVVKGDFLLVEGHFYAPDIFDRIVDGMRNSGEPGIAFYDTINGGNANPHIYALNTSNPCSEQYLPAALDERFGVLMGVCNLSSMHAAHPTFWHKNGTYNFDEMRSVAGIMQRFMDNVTDVTWFPIPAQNFTARMERRNGGGFAGVAEYLSRRGMEFGSPDALLATEELYRHYTQASVESSIKLAEERGVYPFWYGSNYENKGLKVRNTCMTNNAPTGTLAQAMQTTWGVDPHNGIVFSRKVRSRFVDFVAPGFKEAMISVGLWPVEESGQLELMSLIRSNGKSCRGLLQIPGPIQKAFPIRLEVEPVSYIRHIAAVHYGASDYPEAFNAVSNTCSIPLGYPAKKVAEAVLLAYRIGVKSITFYPDGSRTSQPVEQISPPSTSVVPCGNCGGTSFEKADGCSSCTGCGVSRCG